uniref:RNase H type-1 domain-containing protein n=1 Tax=Megaselia scalaris TaxID=36166 RepID=T1H0N6_MEGSC
MKSMFACSVDLVVREECAAHNFLDIVNKNIVICTDRKAAINAISSWVIKLKLVLDCVKMLNNLGNCNKVFLIWVPSHSNLEGNDIDERSTGVLLGRS